jgi:HEAT repeat protein
MNQSYCQVFALGIALALFSTATVTASDEAAVRAAMTTTAGANVATLDDLAARGAEIVPLIEPYLQDPDREVKSRALSVLSRIDGVGSKYVLQALRSDDPVMQHLGIMHARRFPDDPGVARALCKRVIQDGDSSLRGEALGMLSEHMATADTRKAAQAMMPQIVKDLGSYDLPLARACVFFLGRYAKRGDQDVLHALNELQISVENNQHPGVARPDRSDAGNRRAIKVLQAIEVAKAGLGDEDAFRELSDHVSKESKDRSTYLRLLVHLRPSPQSTELLAALLEDETEVKRLANLPFTVYRRTCDFAADAVGAWYPDAPGQHIGPRIYSAGELDALRQWLAQLPESRFSDE